MRKRKRAFLGRGVGSAGKLVLLAFETYESRFGRISNMFKEFNDENVAEKDWLYRW